MLGGGGGGGRPRKSGAPRSVDVGSLPPTVLAFLPIQPRASRIPRSPHRHTDNAVRCGAHSDHPLRNIDFVPFSTQPGGCATVSTAIGLTPCSPFFLCRATLLGNLEQALELVEFSAAKTGKVVAMNGGQTASCVASRDAIGATQIPPKTAYVPVLRLVGSVGVCWRGYGRTCPSLRTVPSRCDISVPSRCVISLMKG